MSQNATADERHRALVQSIRDLASYIEGNPDIPITSVNALVEIDGENVQLRFYIYIQDGRVVWELRPDTEAAAA